MRLRLDPEVLFIYLFYIYLLIFQGQRCVLVLMSGPTPQHRDATVAGTVTLPSIGGVDLGRVSSGRAHV